MLQLLDVGIKTNVGVKFYKINGEHEPQKGTYWTAQKSNSGYSCRRSDASTKDTAGYNDGEQNKGALDHCMQLQVHSFFFLCTFRIILLLSAYGPYLKNLPRIVKKKSVTLAEGWTVGQVGSYSSQFKNAQKTRTD